MTRAQARVTGAVYLLYFVTAILGVRLASLAVNLVSAALYIAVTILFYFLFKPVNRNVSLVAAVVSLAGCAVTVLKLFQLATQVSPLVFFGPYCILLGYLILRSNFLPRYIGVLLLLAGVGWLIFLGLSPASALVRPIEALGIVAEGLLALWLLIFSVRPT